MKKIFATLALSFLLIAPHIANAQTETPEERIISYHSDIEVKADSTIEVTEKIKVYSAGVQIKRGIYRDFPIAYKDRLGKRVIVDFKINNITKNGQAEKYHTEKKGNGIRIYIGEENVFIPNGEYEYAISYTTGRQLGFFNDFDELYWNVTGTEWVFDIESASATIQLPSGITEDKIKTAFYTGKAGSQEQNAQSSIKESKIEFSTTKPLKSYEGLTIAVNWPKGFVEPPSATQNAWSTFKANLDLFVGSFGLILLLLFYFRAWRKYGRDPQKGSVVAMYESPEKMSPAMVRLISKMSSDSKSFTAAIINSAVKGFLMVSENDGGFLKGTKYTITKKASSGKENLSKEEQLLLDTLFASSDSIELTKANAPTISVIQNNFFDDLSKQAGKKYFSKNIGTVVIGVLISIAAIAGAIVSAGLVRYNIDSVLQILFWPVLVIAFIIIHIVFGKLIRAYTPEGRKLADEIEGFKLFLSVTEKDRLAFHNPPEKTPELFEKMLPFALALEVENEWAEQFSEVFKSMAQSENSYSPSWYRGVSTSFAANSFASTIGSSFSGAVASAATPPGSSSGSGGGGSSGGGGGGGGGGGW